MAQTFQSPKKGGRKEERRIEAKVGFFSVQKGILSVRVGVKRDRVAVDCVFFLRRVGSKT